MQSCLHWVKGQLLALLAVLLALGLALALPLVASAHAILLRSDPVGDRSGLASRTAARPLLPGLLLVPDVGHVRGGDGQPCTDGGIDRSDADVLCRSCHIRKLGCSPHRHEPSMDAPPARAAAESWDLHPRIDKKTPREVARPVSAYFLE
jgi:hypothetical protein